MHPILVAGGAGFIGAHLCRALISKGHRVICLDNFVSSQVEGIGDLISSSEFELINHDIIEPFDHFKVSQIYNLACVASPKIYVSRPIETLKTNFQGTLNLLELARENDCRFLQASTSEVYGEPLTSPQDETYFGNVNPIGPRSCYEEGKRVAEALVVNFCAQYGCDGRIGRLFNVYGPGLMPNDGRVISNFITKALSGTPISILGSGNQTRSFCYVSDMVRGLIALMNIERVDGPINLGTDQETTISALAEKIIDLTQSNSKIEHLPSDQGAPQFTKPDIRLALEKLGWKPEIDLDAGLMKTIAAYKSGD